MNLPPYHYHRNITYNESEKSLAIGWISPNPYLSSSDIDYAKQYRNLEKLRVEFWNLDTPFNYLVSGTIEIIKNNPELKTLLLDLGYVIFNESMLSITTIYELIPQTEIKYFVVYSDRKLPDYFIISKKDFTDKFFQEAPNLIYFESYLYKSIYYLNKAKYLREDFKYFNTLVQLTHLPHEINSIILSYLIGYHKQKWFLAHKSRFTWVSKWDYNRIYKTFDERILPIKYFEIIDNEITDNEIIDNEIIDNEITDND